MAHVSVSYHIDAPPEAVWEIGSDPNRIPEWNTTVMAVKDVTGSLEEPGARYTTVSKIAGRQIDVTWTVQRAERPRLAEATGSTPMGGSGRQMVRFEPEDGGTRVDVEVEFEIAPGLLGQLMDRVFAERSVEREIRHSGENFKALVEEQQEALAGASR